MRVRTYGFRGIFYEANPGSSARNIEADQLHVESGSPPGAYVLTSRIACARLGAGLIMLGQQREDGFLGDQALDPRASTVTIYPVVEERVTSGNHERFELVSVRR